MYKIYPSSSAWMWGNLVLTDYNSGCLRSILIQSHDLGVRSGIHPTYMKIGEANEVRHQEKLRQDPKVLGHSREVPFKEPIDESVVLSGRRDFDVIYPGFVAPHECKASLSPTVIRKGEPKKNHLAQLVSYLIQLKSDKGKLIYGYFEFDEAQDQFAWIEGREFKVTIATDGGIYYSSEWSGDREPTRATQVSMPKTFSGFNVADQLAHRMTAAKVLKEQIIWDRPDGHDNQWGGPCGLCVFRNTCDKYDAGELATVEELVESARQDAASYKPSEPKFNVRKKGK